MNHDQFERSKQVMSAAIDVLRGEGISIDQRNTLPLLSAARHAAVTAQPARAFDAAITKDEGYGLGFDSETRAAAHRTLDRCIDAVRRAREERRRLTDEERMDLNAAKTLLASPGSIPPWSHYVTGRAADKEPENDLEQFQQLAFESCGVY